MGFDDGQVRLARNQTVMLEIFDQPGNRRRADLLGSGELAHGYRPREDDDRL